MIQAGALLRKTTSVMHLQKAGYGALLVLIFLQPFNQFGALRLLALAVLLGVLLVLSLREGGWKFRIASWRGTSYLGLAVVAWICICSSIGPYPGESMTAVRQSLLVQIAMFLAGLRFVRGPKEAWALVASALLGFGLVSILSAVEVIPAFWTQGGMQRIYPGHDSWWGGYASSGGFCIPLLFAWLLAGEGRRWTKIAGWVLFPMAIVLVLLYGSRTPLITAIVGILAFLLFSGRKRVVLQTISIAFALILVASISPLGKRFQYDKLLVPETYVTNAGLSGRLGVWQGVIDVINERPLCGYGYGWKKLAWAVNDGGFFERWKSRPDTLLYYFPEGQVARYGRVNPHNYFLQVAFEVGVVGLLLVLGFWGMLVKEGLPLLDSAIPPPCRTYAATVLALLLTYFVANLTNGHWIGGLANLSLAFAAGMLALVRIRLGTPVSPADKP